MKSYNKSKTARHEASFESLDSFGDQFINETKNEIQSMGKGFFDQLMGFQDAAVNDEQFQDNHIDTQTRKNSKKPETSTSTSEGIVFQFVNQLAGVELDKKQKSGGENSSIQQELQAFFNRGEYFNSVNNFSENLTRKEMGEHNKQIREIISELKQLIMTTKELQIEFGQISVEQAPVNPGKYYVNFFEWMLLMIRQARQKVEDSRTWLDAQQGKSQKMGYWGKAKKFGTTFTQSNERGVATSTG